MSSQQSEQTYQHYIDGEWVDGHGSETFESENPATGETLGEFHQGTEADVREATVVTLYLWPEINIRLRPKLLRELDPGDRIVSHDFRVGDWEPDRVVDAGEGNTGEETIYLWTVPETIPDDLMDISDEPIN